MIDLLSESKLSRFCANLFNQAFLRPALLQA
jgi:hypothetical protein